MYGYPNINIVISFINTDVNESLEFIKQIPSIYLIYSFILISLAIYIIKNQKYIKINNNIILFSVFIIVVISTPLSDYCKGKLSTSSFKFTLFKFSNDIISSYNQVTNFNKNLKELINNKSDWNPTPVKNDYDTYIVVIGESVRSDFMHTYGFSLNNTPYLDSINGLIFKNYISASGATQLSLSRTLALSNGKHIDFKNNIIKLAKKQGFRTYWVSNQGSFGNDDSISAMIGKQADSVTFLKKGEYNTEKYLDENLVTPYKSALLDNNYSNKKLIFIHLMGSHPDFCERVNYKYDEFFVNKKLSCYVQSIKNTDTLLSKIASYATQNNKRWTMMYFSDHGLSYQDRDGNITIEHSSSYKKNFHVPFFITSYNDKKRNEINHYRSAFDFMSLYLRWTGSTDLLINKNCDLLSDIDCGDELKIIDFNNNMKNYKNLPDDFKLSHPIPAH
ncbi:MAG: phosphoethanolamine transferase [Enterobacteriaceae bacterium]|nr:phosphoethanolamine transferase [Enterobacteriaceae bacterium]